jgi:hypothetical protein
MKNAAHARRTVKARQDRQLQPGFSRANAPRGAVEQPAKGYSFHFYGAWSKLTVGRNNF